jgi:ribonuclease HII
MHELHIEHPHYGWDHNHGYGTRMHVLALRDYGLTPHHRRQFATTALARLAPHLPGFESNGAT